MRNSLGNQLIILPPTTFKTVSAAWNKNETIIKRLQNIPAAFKELPALEPLPMQTGKKDFLGKTEQTSFQQNSCKQRD